MTTRSDALATRLESGAFAKISRADVAAFILEELEKNAFVCAAPSLLPA